MATYITTALRTRNSTYSEFEKELLKKMFGNVWKQELSKRNIEETAR
jgi:hypothetical protein